MSIAEITVKVNQRYIHPLLQDLFRSGIKFESNVNHHMDSFGLAISWLVDVENCEVTIPYTTQLMDVLKKYFDGLELAIALDNTL
jgi:hypothetical protein